MNTIERQYRRAARLHYNDQFPSRRQAIPADRMREFTLGLPSRFFLLPACDMTALKRSQRPTALHS
ncbi:hypothetical protein J8I26_17770 [Herbaspirillum sp. LeCh32-8]|uniref:hypothetical protein n=1 Tax=Herbaspirillum sp. LeCh32-8 TaxID=2821356 RepID=UPI001AE641AB|nr:hypothetical protein [Herbaspirillum sp. LeCh32-8]MBP0599963.1 hypothetical protein [Herbaspirillum sp. LeCh32-8]